MGFHSMGEGDKGTGDSELTHRMEELAFDDLTFEVASSLSLRSPPGYCEHAFELIRGIIQCVKRLPVPIKVSTQHVRVQRCLINICSH